MPLDTVPRYVKDTSSRLKRIRPLLHLHWNPPFRGAPHQRYNVPPYDTLAPHQLQFLLPDLDLSDPSTPPECLVEAVRNLRQFLPIECKLLGRGDLNITGSHPVAAGGLADVWVGEMNGTMVAIKSFRRYASSSCLPVYLRLYREALACNYLNDGDESFVPFIGLYSAPEHPFCLVFEFMGYNLREHLKKIPDSERHKLLLGVARGLSRLHSLNIFHGNLDINNVLVDADGRTRVAGLGMVSIPSALPVRDTYRPFHAALAPELIQPSRWGLPDASPTAASDLFSFATIAWEVFGGKPPYSDRNVVAGMYSMLSGSLPDRSDNPQLSDRMWKMIRRCWKSNPAKRMTLPEVIAELEAEESAQSASTV